MRVTIRDVAKKAGVSEATVSLVLNGHEGRVSQITRARVLDVVRELDYTPNSIARSLAERVTWTIGLVVSDVIRAPFSSAIKGVESTAMRHGYQVMLFNMDGKASRMVLATELLISNRVDGIVFVLSSRAYPDLPVDRLLKRNTPFALVNHPVDIDGIPCVRIDNTVGTRTLTRQLIELGHRRIGCVHLPIGGKDAVLAAEERLDGYLAALKEKGIAVDPTLIREGARGEVHGEAVGYRIARELLSMDNCPTALVCCNDYLAIGAIGACEDLGLSVPHDVAIVGHDNIPGSAYVRPPLTTVEQPMAEAGRRATQLLVQMIRDRAGGRPAANQDAAMTQNQAALYMDSDDELTDESPDRHRVTLPCSLVIRSSSGHHPRM